MSHGTDVLFKCASLQEGYQTLPSFLKPSLLETITIRRLIDELIFAEAQIYLFINPCKFIPSQMQEIEHRPPGV